MTTLSKLITRIFVIIAVTVTANPALADFCFADGQTWLEDANTNGKGYWTFRPSPGSMAPIEIPFSCFQRPISFQKAGKISFPEPDTYEINEKKCTRAIGNATFEWVAEFNTAFQDWGISVTALTGDKVLTMFMTATCASIEADEQQLTLNPELIEGKTGSIQYIWRSQADD